MVKRNKNNTKDTPKKKTKASTSMDDTRKDLSVDFDTAVSLPQSPQDFQPVSTSLPSTSEGVTMQSSHNPSDSATILAYLKKIDASNEALAKCVQDLEASRTGVQSQSIVANSETPLNLQLPPEPRPLPWHRIYVNARWFIQFQPLVLMTWGVRESRTLLNTFCMMGLCQTSTICIRIREFLNQCHRSSRHMTSRHGRTPSKVTPPLPRNLEDLTPQIQ